MAKISKIRFINFIYNDNRHIYDQTFDFFKGENTLLNLQNGGGKTVLVQMMMQPVVPKLKLKDRVFKNYFINSKAPCYIMIEWILDDRPQRLLTGIGIKQVTGRNPEDDRDSLKIITFLSEYEQECSYDIKNLELLEKEKGIVRLQEFDKVIRNLSSAEKEGSRVWLYRWDSQEDKKEYTRRLLEYRINPSEWKNLMVKINESEAGLNAFFNDCKTTNALIKKWFLPTIEEQLNKNGDFIQNVKELIQNHAIQLVKNESMLKEREIFESFKYRSREVVTDLENYGSLREKAEQNKSDLGNACLSVKRELNSLDIKKEEALRKLKQNEEDKKELEYERLSGEYHEIAAARQSLQENINCIEETMNELKTELEGLEYKRKVLIGSRCQSELKELAQKIAKYEAEMEKENLQQEDKRAIIQDLEYSLRLKYQQRLEQYEDRLRDEKELLKEKNSCLSDTLLEFEKQKKLRETLLEELLKLRGRIAVYEERVEEFSKLYPDDLEKINLVTGEAVSETREKLETRLEQEELQLQNLLLVSEQRQEECKKAAAEADRVSLELEEKNRLIHIDKNKAEEALRIFHKEKLSVEGILKAYQLPEENLFDKEKIVSLLHSAAENYNKLIQDRRLDNILLEQQQELYLSGKVFELSRELRDSLEELDIQVEYGYEWLRNLSENKKDKQRIVKNNPFLPYSLIVSSKDKLKLQNLELSETLTAILPVLEREKLESVILAKHGKAVYGMGNMEFVIYFDDRILNKNYLKEITEDLQARIDKNQSTIANAQEALRNTELALLKIEGFSYTALEVEKLKEALLGYDRDLQLNMKIIETNRIRKMELLQELSECYQQYTRRQNGKQQFERKKEDILGLLSRYEEVCLVLEDKKRKEEKAQQTEAVIKKLDKDLILLREEVQEKNQRIASAIVLLEQDRNSYQNYRDVKEGHLIEDEIEKLESRRSVLLASTSGKLQNLQDILEDYRHRRGEKEKELNELGLVEGFDLGIEFRESELNTILAESKENNRKQKLKQEEKNKLQFSLAEKSSDLRYIEKSILERCGYGEPKVVALIRKLDFKIEQENLLSVRREIEKQIAGLKAREGSLQKVMFTLGEYETFTARVTEPFEIPEDLNGYVAELIKKYKEYENRLVEVKNELAADYQRLEAEFIDQAEMFKGLFQSILGGEKRYQPIHALNAINRVYLQIDRKLEQHSIDLKKIDEMEGCIIDNTMSYLKNVYDELNGLDRNSVIEVDKRRCKMLLIELPEKTMFDTISLREYLKNTIIKCENLYRQGKPADGLLMNEINTYDLFDRFVGMNKIQINLMKIEPNRLKKKSWKQVIEENSGGERFVNAFVVFISLLTYMRGENLLAEDMDSKVLIMDNPFGPITSEHLLKPLFEIALKYNTQLICLSDLKEHTIFDRFNLIYSLNIEREVGREEEYIELKTIKKDLSDHEEEVISASMFRIEDRSRFELMN